MPAVGKNTLLQSGAGIVAGLFAFCLALGAIYRNETVNLRAGAQQVLAIAGNAVQEREAIFNQVGQFNGASCDEALLLNLRKLLVSKRRIGDVVVFGNSENTIQCSAVAGRLAQPYKLGSDWVQSPRYSNRPIWLAAKPPYLADGRSYYLVRDGHFGVILFSDSLTSQDLTFSWELVAVDNEGKFVFHNYGDVGLWQAYERWAAFPFTLKLMQKLCTFEGGNVCVIATRPASQVFLSNLPIIVVSCILSTLLALLTFQWSGRRLEKQQSAEGRVISAIRNKRIDAFYCVYQPIVDLQTKTVVGCEVLARFQDIWGPLAPSEFIPVIDRAGLSWAFTEMLLENIVRDSKSLPDLQPGFRLSINFYPRDLESVHLQRIKNCNGLEYLHKRGFQIVCEILETGIDEFNSADETIHYLKAMGFKIAIDDFGTGFSNLKQLKDFNADYLKIDKSFTDDIREEHLSVKGSLIPHILGIAKELRIEVIAEGVESDWQSDCLRALGAEFGQGYLFSKPLPIVQFIAFLGSSTKEKSYIPEDINEAVA